MTEIKRLNIRHKGFAEITVEEQEAIEKISKICLGKNVGGLYTKGLKANKVGIIFDIDSSYIDFKNKVSINAKGPKKPSKSTSNILNSLLHALYNN